MSEYTPVGTKLDRLHYWPTIKSIEQKSGYNGPGRPYFAVSAYAKSRYLLQPVTLTVECVQDSVFRSGGAS